MIVLDFDGVIVESNNIKHEAFSEIFSEFPDYYQQIMSYHYAHNAVNRHDKFRYVMENILKQNYDTKRAEDWATRFSTLTRERIIQCPYVAGALEFVQYFSGRYPLYVASATPIDELNIILQKREIQHYFNRCYGAPASKKTMLEYITNDEKVIPGDILYIGDSREDYETAKDAGCCFLGRKSNYDFNGLEVIIFKNLSEMKSYILKKLDEDGEINGLLDTTF